MASRVVAFLARLRQLGVRKLVHVVRFAALAAATELGLRVLPLPRLAAWLGVPLDLSAEIWPPGGFEDLDLSARERRQLWALHAVLARRPFNGTCLRRALLVGHVIRRHGPVLVLGLGKGEEGLSGHAWIQVARLRIDPDTEHDYTVFNSPPDQGGFPS